MSELIERGAPNKDLLNALFIVYNILLILFAIGLYSGLPKKAATSLITIALIINSILGVVWTLFFPLDVGGTSASLTGMLHLIVGALVVPLIFFIKTRFLE